MFFGLQNSYLLLTCLICFLLLLFFIFLSYKYIEKTKKRKKKGNQNEAPPLQKPADDFSVLFLKVKLPFACWLPSAMPQQKGEGGLISQGLRGRNPPPPPTTAPRFARELISNAAALALPAARSSSQLLVNGLILCLSLLFSSDLSEGLSCIHFKQTNRTSPEWGHVQVSRTCLWGRQAGWFFFEQNKNLMCCETHQQQPFSTTREAPGCFHS